MSSSYSPPSRHTHQQQQQPRGPRPDPPTVNNRVHRPTIEYNNNINSDDNDANITMTTRRMAPPTLPSGEIVDAKNTVRSHTIIATEAAATMGTIPNNDHVEASSTTRAAASESQGGRSGNTTMDQMTEKNTIQSALRPGSSSLTSSSSPHMTTPTTSMTTLSNAPVVGISVPITQQYRRGDNVYYDTTNRTNSSSHDDNNNIFVHYNDNIVDNNHPLLLQNVLVEARYIHDAASTPNVVVSDSVAASSNNNTATTNTNNSSNKCNRTHILLGVMVVAISAIAVGFLVCGGDGCSKSSSMMTTTTLAQAQPTVPFVVVQPTLPPHAPSVAAPVLIKATSTANPSFPPGTTNTLAPFVPIVTLAPTAAQSASPAKATSNPTSMPSVAESVPPSVMATTVPPTLLPTPSQDRTEQIVSFINSITLSGRTIASPGEVVPCGRNGCPIEEPALSWIIIDDPLQLLPDTPSHQFQLMQRYALRTIIAQQPVPNEWSDNSTWLLSECEWVGINCSSVQLGNDFGQQQAVTKIDFYANDVSLQGILPADIGLLSALLYIDVGTGYLDGTLPDSIGNWQNVTFVGLCCNEFSGSLPTTIGNWQSATTVSLWNNQLTGSLPTSIGNWQSVTKVNLWNNKLNGSLPTSIGNWQSVKEVSLQNNRLTGSLPTSIGNWQSVTEVSLFNNTLNGTLSTSIGNWQSVTWVDLSDNQLTGTFPNSIGTNWTNLRYAYLQSNNFTGTVPMSWCQLTTRPYLVTDCKSEVICNCCTTCY